MDRHQLEQLTQGVDALRSRFGKNSFPDLVVEAFTECLQHYTPMIIRNVMRKAVSDTRFANEVTTSKLKEIAQAELAARGTQLAQDEVKKFNPNCLACKGEGSVRAVSIAGDLQGYTTVWGCPECCSHEQRPDDCEECWIWDWNFERHHVRGNVWILRKEHDSYRKHCGQPPGRDYSNIKKKSLMDIMNPAPIKGKLTRLF